MRFVAISLSTDHTCRSADRNDAPETDGKALMRFLLTMAVCSVLAMLPAQADAFDVEQSPQRLHGQYPAANLSDFTVAKSDGMTLAQAIETVRRQTNGRILSAETRVSGGREVHHIKVLTKDGKVKTVKIPGRKRG